MKFDIPINITAIATNEQKAENQVMEFMIKAIREFGIEHRIADFQYYEFVTQESSDSGCRDNDVSEGQQSCNQKQACNCSKQSCC